MGDGALDGPQVLLRWRWSQEHMEGTAQGSRIGQCPRSVDKQKTPAFSACNLLPFKSFPTQPERGRKEG